MPHARVTVEVPQHESTRTGDARRSGRCRSAAAGSARRRSGVDEVELLLAANTGADARPLHKGASGGELSRVMLAVEVALAGTSPVPTFVFDEVDAGRRRQGGDRDRAQARRSWRARAGPGRHAPAAGGGVRRPARRRTQVERRVGHHVRPDVCLDEAERERELSRMLAGLEDSDSALAHARELLDAPPRPSGRCPRLRRATRTG